MDKLKSMLGSKSGDAHGNDQTSSTDQGRAAAPVGGLQGEGSHLAGAKQSAGNEDEGFHPIYDQFTGQSTSGEPTKATEQPPHFSNTTNLNQTPGDSVGAGAGGLGTRELTDRTKDDTSRQQMHALADGRTSNLNAQPSSQPIAEKPTGRPLERSAEEPNVTTDTDRSFPLAGGVTHRAPAENESAPSEVPPTITEREQGTKDRQAEKNHGDGREALAGAAAAGAAATAYGLHSDHERKATSDAPSGLKTEGDFGSQPPSGSRTGGDLNSTTGDASTAYQDLHGHRGQGHTYDGPRFVDEQKSTQAAPMLTEGPHVTDAANRFDPHMHVPGEFPDPTPVEEPSQPSFAGKTEGPVSLPSASQSAGTTSNLAGEKQAEGHHYGRDAAVAGGAGAAGLGAYEANKHHQREPADIGDEPKTSYSSPYSSQKLDPRVNPSARGVAGLDEQRFDPTAKTESSPYDSARQHHGRDAALAGGAAAGAGGLAEHEASKHHAERETTQPTASQQQTPSSQAPTSQGFPQTQNEPKEKDHHYGRDAAIAGAGATAAGGLYESQKKDSGPASNTIGPHKSNIANVLDPRVKPDPALQKHHQAGPTQEDPASFTVGPHKSNTANVVDPRVQPEPEKMKGHTTTGPHQSDTLNRLDPKADEKAQTQDQHHYGRDAALAGGAGTAGVGAYEAAEKYDQHRSTQPSSSMENQRYDPTAQGAHDPAKSSQHHYGRDAAAAGGVGAAGVGAHEYAKHDQQTAPGATGGNQSAFAQQLSATDRSAPHDPQSQHHYGRDAAVAGGVGAVGAGAYEYAQHDGKAVSGATTGTQPSSAQQPSTKETQPQHHYGRDTAAAGGAGAAGVGAYEYAQHHDKAAPASSAVPSTSTQQPHSSPNTATQEAQDPTKASQHHYGRDAALAGGAGAAGVGAYEYAQHRDQAPHGQTAGIQDQSGAHQRYDSVQDPNNQQHQKRDAAVAAGATGAAGAGAGHEFSKHEAEKHQKEQEKAFHKQQKELEKQQAKEHKEHSKLVAAENKKHEKEMEKEHQKQVKEAEKEEEPKEKKHHLFGFLHRDKKEKDETAESEPRTSKESPRHSKEYAAAGAGAAGAGAATYAATRNTEQPSSAATSNLRPDAAHRGTGDTSGGMSTASIKSGVLGFPQGGDDKHAALGNESSVSAGAAGHDSDSNSPTGKHRNKLHKDPPPGHPAREAMEQQQQQDHRVIEPHTGLPMNVGKYGDGAGGTDGSETVSGYHNSPEQGQGQGVQGTTDWEGVKKANTPY